VTESISWHQTLADQLIVRSVSPALNCLYCPFEWITWLTLLCQKHRKYILVRINGCSTHLYSPIQPSPSWYHCNALFIISQYFFTRRGSRWFCPQRWSRRKQFQLYDSMNQIPFLRRSTAVSILLSCLIHLTKWTISLSLFASYHHHLHFFFP